MHCVAHSGQLAWLSQAQHHGRRPAAWRRRLHRLRSDAGGRGAHRACRARQVWHRRVLRHRVHLHKVCSGLQHAYQRKQCSWLHRSLPRSVSTRFTTRFPCSELFPTQVRSAVLGYENQAARVGGIMAPFIVMAGSASGGGGSNLVPFLTFGATSMLAGLLIFTLPETLGVPLPDTMQVSPCGRCPSQKRRSTPGACCVR